MDEKGQGAGTGSWVSYEEAHSKLHSCQSLYERQASGITKDLVWSKGNRRGVWNWQLEPSDLLKGFLPKDFVLCISPEKGWSLARREIYPVD